MARKTTPVEFAVSGMRLWQMQAQASAVMAMRVWGMMGAWAMPPSEWSRMVTEKQAAFAEAGRKMALAAMSGAAPLAIHDKGLQPIARTVRGNARRLPRKIVKSTSPRGVR